MASIELRTEFWPIVVTVLPTEVTVGDFDAYLERFSTDVLGRGQLFASVIDALAMKNVPSALVRQRIAAWEQEHLEVGKRFNAGIAMATPSLAIRGAMTAINWVVPPAVPTTYEATVEDAIAWAAARLAERGVHVPASSRAYRSPMARTG